MPGKYELKQSKDGQFMFNLLATNGQVILTSETYKAKKSALNGIESVRKNSPDAAQYERRTGKGGKEHFVLKAKNHQIIGTSQRYKGAAALEKGVKSVMTNGPKAKLADLTVGEK